MLNRRTFVHLLIGTSYSSLARSKNPQPPLILAKTYNEDIKLLDYWVSEKLDGVRAYWDGEKLLSRNGNIYPAPPWFIADFPNCPLDGELWMGRSTFDKLSGTVRRHHAAENAWRKVRFMVFDLPSNPNSFTNRYEALETLFFGLDSSNIALVPQTKISTHQALKEHLTQAVQQGAEGLMLHRGDSLYLAGRSDGLLKVKIYEDSEATVIAHFPGKGKHQGKLGALLVESPEGQRFRIGTGFSNHERSSPPPIGSTITYKFYGLTPSGLPRFASFIRARNDY